MNGRDDDNLDEFIRGSSDVSRIYRASARQSPPAALDRRVLAAARVPRRHSGHRVTLPFAASVLLALAVVFALTVVPRTIGRRDDGPRFLRTTIRSNEATGMHLVYPTLKPTPAGQADLARGILIRNTQLYSSDPTGSRTLGSVRRKPPDPAAWLSAITALRAAGRVEAADSELRRLRAAYPSFAAADSGAGAAER